MGIYMAVISSFPGVVARRLGASALLVALLTSAPMASSLVGMVSARLIHGPRALRYTVGAWSIARGLFFLTPLLAAPAPFVVIVSLHWLVVALPMPAYVDMMRRVYPAALRGRAMSYVRVAFTVCLTLATPLAGSLMDLWGYQILFPVVACFGIAAALTFGQMRLPDEAAGLKATDGMGRWQSSGAPDKALQVPRSQEWAPWRVFKQDMAFRTYVLSLCLWGVGLMMTMPLLTLLLVDELHLSYGQVGLLGLVNSVFWTIFYVIWGRTVDQRGGLWTVQTTVLVTIGAPIVFYFTHDIGVAAVGYIFIGVINAGIDLGWINVILQFAADDQLADYTALHAGFAGLRGVIAPVLGTVLMGVPWIGLRGVFAISIGVLIVSWLLMRRVRAPLRVPVV